MKNRVFGILLSVCFFLPCLADAVAQDAAVNDSAIAEQFVKAASKYVAEEGQFSYKSQANRFGHFDRPWATRQLNHVGMFSLRPSKFLMNELSQSGTATRELRSFYSPKTLYQCDADNRPAGVTSDEHETFLRTTCRFTPSVLIAKVIESLGDLESGQNEEVSVVRQEKELIAAGVHHDESFEVHFSDGKLNQIIWMRSHEMFGDQKIEFTYSKEATNDRLTFPTQIEEKTFDVTTFMTEVDSASKDKLLEIEVPDDHRLKTQEIEVATVEVDKYSDNVTFLHLPHCDSRSALIEFKDFLMVIDAPKTSANGKLILETIDGLGLNKPVKYFAFGHHHPHYFGGVRPFVARGATVLTTKKIAPYVKQVVEFEHSRVPDELQTTRKNVLLKTFEGEVEISDGEYSVKIFDIGIASKHTIDYLLTYFPKERMIFQGDGVWLRDGQPVRGRTKAIYDAVENLNLNVVESIQGWPTQNYGVRTKVKYQELKEAIEATGKQDKQMEAKKSDAELARASFEKLKTLVGKWKRSNDNKNELIEFQLFARDSVVVETWMWPDKGSNAMTVYHMDGDTLMSTHYCPCENQPKLLFVPDASDPKMVFKFDSITNLPDRSVSHCVEFWIEIEDENSITRSETYREKDEIDVSEATYSRVRNGEG